jgi:hypothetical protein
MERLAGREGQADQEGHPEWVFKESVLLLEQQCSECLYGLRASLSLWPRLGKDGMGGAA